MKKNDHDTTTRLSLGTVLPGTSKIDVNPSQNFTREQKKKDTDFFSQFKSLWSFSKTPIDTYL
jgi:hypothetical protein